MGKKEDAVIMHESGLTVEAIADELGISSSYVYKLLGDAGIELAGRRAGRKSVLDQLTQEDREAIVKAYAEGVPVYQIITEWKLSYNSFYKLLTEMQVPIGRPSSYAKEVEIRTDIAIQMYAEGAPLWEIFEETGVHQPRLHQELHRRGVPLRRFSRKQNEPGKRQRIP